MAIFAVGEAKHFCKGYKALQGTSAASFRNYTRGLANTKTFSEGTPDFDELRDGAVRECERLLFLAMSNYRRSLCLMTASTASWAYVTMYYSSFYAANSLLGMFGCWKLSGVKTIEVIASTPGSQSFALRTFRSTHGGSHAAFWDYFYKCIATLVPWVDSSLRFAIEPIQSNVTWLTENRNDLNYDSYAACSIMHKFQGGFRKTKPIATLPGVINTQFRVTEALLQITATYAREFAVATDALDQLKPVGKRRDKVRKLIIEDELPTFVRQVRKRTLTV